MKTYVRINGLKCELLQLEDTVVDNKRLIIVIGKTESKTILSMVFTPHSIYDTHVRTWKNEDEANIHNVVMDFFENVDNSEVIE